MSVRGIGIALIFLLTACSARADPFDTWLAGVEHEAQALGVQPEVTREAFEGLAPMQDVLDKDRAQPENRLTFQQYMDNTVTLARIQQGKAMLSQYHDLLKEIGKRYGVDPEYIVALWGMETNFGRNAGHYDLIQSLATLAYDGRRSAFFRGELIDALFILQQEHMSATQLTGSWAGAMGQCQFMPSSFLRYAVDYDHDGRRDIWNDPADVFASIANYLSAVGWHKHEGWGIAVKLPPNPPQDWLSGKTEMTMGNWARKGMLRVDGTALPDTQERMRLIFPAQGDVRVAYLVTPNYNTILDWNRSLYFATSVGTLADAIREE
jgi:membrane-bound lytic murein transglycosylase B